MALFWIVNEVKGERRVWIQEADSSVYAKLRASMAGFEGEFVELHQLDAKTEKRVPKRSIGRVLSADEAQVLLKRLG